MPTNKTTWMLARSITVQGHTRPHTYTSEDDETNTVACLMIQRSNGIGTLIIEGRPEELHEVGRKLMAEAERIVAETDASPGLRSLYGRI